jgi:hypothetical protein
MDALPRGGGTDAPLAPLAPLDEAVAVAPDVAPPDPGPTPVAAGVAGAHDDSQHPNKTGELTLTIPERMLTPNL